MTLTIAILLLVWVLLFVLLGALIYDGRSPGAKLYEGECIDCGGRLLKGPEGLGGYNVKCEDCKQRYWLNMVFMIHGRYGSDTWERIS